MVDYLIWPWFERFPVIPILYGDIAKIPEDRFPTLVTLVSLMEMFKNVQVLIFDYVIFTD